MTVKTHNNTKGLARAFDARTGKLIWTFKTIPKPASGGDTWLDNSWAINGNTGVWTQITVDEELGLVYLPVESPTSDYYGGKRPGNNLYAESLVCVDLRTGKRKWHFQFVHHPIWDHDMSSAPLIADVNIDGSRARSSPCPASRPGSMCSIASPASRSGRSRRRRCRRGTCPASGTRRRSRIRRPALMYGRNAVRFPEDLIDFTPELRAQAKKKLERYKRYPASSTTRRLSATWTGCSARSTWAMPTAARTGPAAATIPTRTRSLRRRRWRRSRRNPSRRRRGLFGPWRTRPGSSVRSSASGCGRHRHLRRRSAPARRGGQAGGGDQRDAARSRAAAAGKRRLAAAGTAGLRRRPPAGPEADAVRGEGGGSTCRDCRS